MLSDAKGFVKTTITGLSLLIAAGAAQLHAQDDDRFDATSDSFEDESSIAEPSTDRPTLGVCLAAPDLDEEWSEVSVEVAEAEGAEGSHLDAKVGGGACLVGASQIPGAVVAAVADEVGVTDPAGSEEFGEAVTPSPAASPNVESAPARSALRQTRIRSSAPLEPLKAWWPQATQGGLNLQFAGEASFGSAIALLFDSAFDDAGSANRHVKVVGSNGEPVQGRWVLAGNPNMLLFKADPGVYTLKIEEGLSAQGNRKLGAPSSGQVYLR